MYPDIIEGQAAAALEVQFHLGRNTGQIGRLLFGLLRNLLNHFLSHAKSLLFLSSSKSVEMHEGAAVCRPFRFYQITYFSQNLCSITAAWARVAWPWGVRVEPSPVPLMTPAPQAHCMAEMAYSATSKASV